MPGSNPEVTDLRNICLPVVKGAHDSDFIIHNGKAYVVYMANDVRPGEAPDWSFVYFTVTQGEPSDGHSCKQRIMFGKL